MPTAYLTRVVEFAATHRFRPPSWSPERVAATFGKAAGDHAHRYTCGVTVKGPVSSETGGVMSLEALKQIVAEEVTARFDGRHINEDVPEFQDGGGRLPTGETLAVYIWERVAARLPSGVRLHAVRVQEGPHLYSEYCGEA